MTSQREPTPSESCAAPDDVHLVFTEAPDGW